MSSPSEISSDLAMLIAQTWKVAQDNRIDFEGICRIWAYDFGWFDIDKSLTVRDNLVETGWLKVDGVELLPAFSLDEIEIPFNWMPSMRVLENPPILSLSDPLNSEKEDLHPKKKDEQINPEKEDIQLDPATAHIKALLEQISSSSKLEMKEILRRAQRKRRALGPVTLWMALLLVAKEQRLSMPELMQTIA